MELHVYGWDSGKRGNDAQTTPGRQRRERCKAGPKIKTKQQAFLW